MWPLTVSRYLALVFAIVLAIIEALLNMSRPHWQYAPLWIIDYVIVLAMLAGFRLARQPRHIPVLMAGWALAAGVFYMALFISLDPEMKWDQDPDPVLLSLIGLALVAQLLGFVFASMAYYRSTRAGRGA